MNSDDATARFETLYADANGDMGKVPWANRRPNRLLVDWLSRERPAGRGRRCCVVGCGLGDDAELLDRHGFSTHAFDISPTAIAWAKKRFPSTRVKYVVDDLFNLSESSRGPFEFVFESYTVQALPVELRERAVEAVAKLVAPGGTLLLLARGRDAADELRENPPWPLTIEEVRLFESAGLRCQSFEDLFDDETPPVRRFRATFERPGK